MSYTVIILSCFTYDTERGNERLKQIENTLRYVLRKSVIYEEKGRLIILAAGYLITRLQKEFGKICREDSNIYAGIGTTERRSGILMKMHIQLTASLRRRYRKISYTIMNLGYISSLQM